MDKSEQYIKMCNCEEIQGWWVPEVGDWTDKGKVVRVFKDQVWLAFTESGTTIDEHKSQLIWLPLQWQWQEMVKKGRSIHALLDDFYEWRSIFYIDTDSAEQLWLAYFFQELHQKRWTGEKWEKP